MTPDEVIRVVRENIGRKIKVTPLQWGENTQTTPAIVLVESVGEEGFNCYDFSDPTLIDPTVPNWGTFSEIAEVEPIEDSK